MKIAHKHFWCIHNYYCVLILTICNYIYMPHCLLLKGFDDMQLAVGSRRDNWHWSPAHHCRYHCSAPYVS